MIPILYATINEGTVPSHYGLGALTDAVSVSVNEQRNASYELTMVYPANGIHAEDIEPNRFIIAKPNYTDDPQIFRIYKVGKEMNGKFTVNAQHISYDLSGKVIESGSASSCVQACALLQTKAGNFTITTDKTVSASFKISEPSSVRSWFGGKEGSLLDVFGTGEWAYNNYSCSLKSARGSDRNVTIRYGKNLTQLSQVMDMTNLATAILPYYIDQDGNKTVGSKVNTGLVLDVPREKAVDFSQDVDPESSTPILTQLSTLANKYISGNNLTLMNKNITLDFVQLQGLTERVDLCDTVHIYFEPLGITASAKCIETEWDVLTERYTKTVFGDPKTNIADTISVTAKAVEEKPSVSYMQWAVNHATDLITGNLGGYVVLHDSNGDGEPDEILIMDTADITTATKVWRWNKNGLGYSSTGYAGTYGTAITNDGKIVADYVSTGVLNADLIKAGTIEDVNHNSSINMTSGVAKMRNLDARYRMRLLGESDTIKFQLVHNVGGGTNMTFFLNNGTDVGGYTCSDTGGLGIILKDKNGNLQAGISNDINLYNSGTLTTNLSSNGLTISNIGSLDGNGLTVNKSNGNPMGKITLNSYGRGQLDLYNEYNSSCATLYGDGGLGLGSGGSFNITAIGNTGVITCISLVQTSSRETKKNIEPMEDAEKILGLKPVKFDFKNETFGTDQRGFIAEEVKEVLPNLVIDGETPALNYSGMIPYLVAMVQKQEERIRALEEKLNGNIKSE